MAKKLAKSEILRRMIENELLILDGIIKKEISQALIEILKHTTNYIDLLELKSRIHKNIDEFFKKG